MKQLFTTRVLLMLALGLGLAVAGHAGLLQPDVAGGLGMFAMAGAISFNNIPANVRVPLFYAEVDNSQAGYFSQPVRALIIGQKLTAGTAAANVPVLVGKADEARALFGIGSMLARMHEVYRLNDPFGEVWCLPVADPAGAAATGSIAFTGPATKAGTLSIYIGAQKVQVAVASGDAATAIATAVAAAINADTTLPVTAAAATSNVNLTARHIGLLGNDILVQLNYRGSAGGEALPTGVGATVTAMAGGTGTPVLTTAIANMGDSEYDFIILPFADTTTLDALRTLLNDATGRWAWSRQIYGHAYVAKRDSFANLQALGAGRNDQHVTLAGFETTVPSTAWDYVAAYGARNAVYIAADPARPTQTGELVGILAAPGSARFIMTERQTLLSSGIATSYVGGGAVRVERAITTYQKNLWNQNDPSYLDSETMHSLAYILRRLRARITSKYPRHKLANDGTRFGAGQAIVTPAVIRGELAAEYADLEELGITENAEAFAANLIVERNATDPNRLDVLLPPDLVNQLRVFGVLAQFRLQY